MYLRTEEVPIYEHLFLPIDVEAVIGNQQFLLGKEIVGHDLATQYGGRGFDADTPESCQAECLARQPLCGAWTYKAGDQCYLKHPSACCNQTGNVGDAASAISGFLCPQCWSTSGPCQSSCNHQQLIDAFLQPVDDAIGGVQVQDLSATVSTYRISLSTSSFRKKNTGIAMSYFGLI